ncbi:MAG: hypothetical protein ACOC5A_00355 [Halanaerobiales bacterium]
MRENKILKFGWIPVCIIILITVGCERITNYGKTYQLTGRIVKPNAESQGGILLSAEEDTEVVLRDEEGREIDSTKTDEGSFCFFDLKAGCYSLQIFEYSTANNSDLRNISVEEDVNLGDIVMKSEREKSEAEKLLVGVENSIMGLVDQYRVLGESWESITDLEPVVSRLEQIREILGLWVSLPYQREKVEGVEAFFPGEFTVDHELYQKNEEDENWLISEPDYGSGLPDGYKFYDEWEYVLNLINYYDEFDHTARINISNLWDRYNNSAQAILLNLNFTMNYSQDKEEDSDFTRDLKLSYTVEDTGDFSTVELNDSSEMKIRYPNKVEDLTVSAEFDDQQEEVSSGLPALGDNGARIEDMKLAYDFHENMIEVDGDIRWNGINLSIEDCELKFSNLDLKENILKEEDPVLLEARVKGGLLLETDDIRIDLDKLEINRDEEYENPEYFMAKGEYWNFKENEDIFFGGKIVADFEPADFDFDFAQPVRFLRENEQKLDISGEMDFNNVEEMGGRVVFTSKGDGDIIIELLNLMAKEKELDLNLEVKDDMIQTANDGTQSFITGPDGEVKAVIDRDWIVDFFPGETDEYSRSFDIALINEM